jgi:hypothetical protein
MASESRHMTSPLSLYAPSLPSVFSYLHYTHQHDNTDGKRKENFVVVAPADGLGGRISATWRGGRPPAWTSRARPPCEEEAMQDRHSRRGVPLALAEWISAIVELVRLERGCDRGAEVQHRSVR